MGPLKSTLDTALLGLAVLLCAAWISTAQAAALCGTNCEPPPPSQCNGTPYWCDTTFMGCVGGVGCSGDFPCCCGIICWFHDVTETPCGNDDGEQCYGLWACSAE